MLELELKATVPDVVALRGALAGVAVLGFDGLLRDQRFDLAQRDLTDRDEVLRIRRWEGRDGSLREQLAWKGPTHLVDGYKARRELEIWCGGPDRATDLVAALGYIPTHAIDRWVEVWQADGATARIEWYPELTTLVEVEGTGDAIEQLISAIDVDRSRFTTWALPDFERDYQMQTGRVARVSLLSDDERPGHWPA